MTHALLQPSSISNESPNNFYTVKGLKHLKQRSNWFPNMISPVWERHKAVTPVFWSWFRTVPIDIHELYIYICIYIYIYMYITHHISYMYIHIDIIRTYVHIYHIYIYVYTHSCIYLPSNPWFTNSVSHFHQNQFLFSAFAEHGIFEGVHGQRQDVAWEVQELGLAPAGGGAPIKIVMTGGWFVI